MVRTKYYRTLEEAITAFEEQSKPTIKEYRQHQFFSPEAKRKHHTKAKSAGGNNRREKKPQGRRY